MSRVVWKYPIPVEGEFFVEMPHDARVLCVQTQFNKPHIWVMCSEEAARDLPPRRFHFRLAGTGHAISSKTIPGQYIGSFQLDGGELVFHLFHA